MFLKGLRDADFISEYQRFLKWAMKKIPLQNGSKDTALELALEAAKRFEQSATLTFIDYQLWTQRFSNLLARDRQKALEWARQQIRYVVSKDRAEAANKNNADSSTANLSHRVKGKKSIVTGGTVEASLFGGPQTFISVAQRMYYECTGGTKLTPVQKKKIAQSVAIIACVHSKSATLSLADLVAFEKKLYQTLRQTPVPERPLAAGRMLVTEAARLKNERKKTATARTRVKNKSVRSVVAYDGCCPDFDQRFNDLQYRSRLAKEDGSSADLDAGHQFTEQSATSVRNSLPDGLIDHREEGVCPKTGEKMLKVWIRGENPQEVWFAEGSRVVMPIKQQATASSR